MAERPSPPAYDAERYELVHRGTPGDLDFYVDAVGGAGSVLELGCGYGRVLAALARARPEVALVGVDLHAGLLDRARARVPESVRLVHADLAAMRLGERFDLVIAPYSTLYCLPDDASVRACFRTVVAHLRPGGRFVFDAYAADPFHGHVRPEPGDEAPSFVCEVHAGDRGYRVFERSTWRPEAQAFTVRYLYEPIDGGESAEEVIEHRYLLAEQVVALLEAGGLELDGLWGGFGREPFDDDAEHLVIEASLPTAARRA